MEEYAYIEILIEDQSGEILVKNIMDKYITEVPGITYKIHSFKGIGKIPKKVNKLLQVKTQKLLNDLPMYLKGIGRTLESMPGKKAIFVILDSDDAWTADKLEKQIRLQKEKNADLVYTGSAFMDSSGNSIEWYLHVPLEIGYRQLLKQNLISNSSALVRKELYMQYYASGDNMHEDFAIWLRILKTGRKAYGIDEPLLIYRFMRKSKSGTKLIAAKMNWNTYRYIGLDVVSRMYYMIWYMLNGLKKYITLNNEVAKV